MFWLNRVARHQYCLTLNPVPTSSLAFPPVGWHSFSPVLRTLIGANRGLPGVVDDGLRVAEDGGDVLTGRGLDVEEVGLGGLYQSLELVGLELVLVGRVQQVNVHKLV